MCEQPPTARASETKQQREYRRITHPPNSKQVDNRLGSFRLWYFYHERKILPALWPQADSRLKEDSMCHSVPLSLIQPARHDANPEANSPKIDRGWRSLR
jgi:hypothetical protein